MHFYLPFLTSLYIGAGMGWRAVAYTVVTGSALACLFYALMELDYNWPKESKKAQQENKEQSKETFYKNPVFYIMGFLLFLYLGLENCVNGWFVTYFKSMGIMSSAYATNLVSVTWIMVMLGRLLTAKLSAKIVKNKLIFSYCIATAAFFILLIATHNLAVITVAIAGLGFFFAGIYPTSVSSAGCGTKRLKHRNVHVSCDCGTRWYRNTADCRRAGRFFRYDSGNFSVVV